MEIAQSGAERLRMALRVQGTPGGTVSPWNNWPSRVWSLGNSKACAFGRSVVQTWHDKQGQVAKHQLRVECDYGNTGEAISSHPLRMCRSLFASCDQCGRRTTKQPGIIVSFFVGANCGRTLICNSGRGVNI